MVMVSAPKRNCHSIHSISEADRSSWKIMNFVVLMCWPLPESQVPSHRRRLFYLCEEKEERRLRLRSEKEFESKMVNADWKLPRATHTFLKISGQILSLLPSIVESDKKWVEERRNHLGDPIHAAISMEDHSVCDTKKIGIPLEP